MKPRELLDAEPAAYLRAGIEAFAEGLADLRGVLDIPEDLDAVEWIERFFCLSPETTGQVMPMKLYGYQRGMVRAMTAPSTDEWYGPKSTRTGVTQIAAGVGAYYVKHKHSQVMLVQPTEQKAQEFANDYWTPAFRDSPELSKIVRRPVKGERQDTWDVRLYANGGMMRLGWAMSDGTFRGRTAQILMGDEVDDDGWTPTGEKSQGDKFKLFKDRGKTRTGSRLLLWSSPLRRKTSRIWPAWEKTDKQYYFVPCPHCQEKQRLRWGGKDTRYGVKPHYGDDGALKGVYYMCEHCEELIADDRETREWMDEHGEWRATATPARRGVVGQHISALYSMAPKVSWTSLWEEWIDAQGDPDALKHFFNSNLGEPWDDVVTEQRTDDGSFANRAVPYAAEVPLWVRHVTMNFDTQRGGDDPDAKGYLPPRHELQVVGWGPGEEWAVLGYHVLEHLPFSREAAAALDALIFRKWVREDGMRLQAVVCTLDCSYLMDEALQFATAPHRAKVCVPIRGDNETGEKLAPLIIAEPGEHRASGKRFVRVGTRTGKNTMSRRLRQDTPGPGYGWFPSSLRDALPEGYDYYKGLFAERRVRDRRGVETWERISKSNTGEAWDTLIGNLVAIRLAMAKYPQVARSIQDRSEYVPHPVHEGEDRSAMADAALALFVAKGTGGGESAVVPVRQAYAPPPVPQVRAPRKPIQVRSTFGGLR